MNLASGRKIQAKQFLHVWNKSSNMTWQHRQFHRFPFPIPSSCRSHPNHTLTFLWTIEIFFSEWSYADQVALGLTGVGRRLFEELTRTGSVLPQHYQGSSQGLPLWGPWPDHKTWVNICLTTIQRSPPVSLFVIHKLQICITFALLCCWQSSSGSRQYGCRGRGLCHPCGTFLHENKKLMLIRQPPHMYTFPKYL